MYKYDVSMILVVVFSCSRTPSIDLQVHPADPTAGAPRVPEVHSYREPNTTHHLAAGWPLLAFEHGQVHQNTV